MTAIFFLIFIDNFMRISNFGMGVLHVKVKYCFILRHKLGIAIMYEFRNYFLTSKSTVTLTTTHIPRIPTNMFVILNSHACILCAIVYITKLIVSIVLTVGPEVYRDVIDLEEASQLHPPVTSDGWMSAALNVS